MRAFKSQQFVFWVCLVFSSISAVAATTQTQSKEEGFSISGGRGLNLLLKGYGQFLGSALSEDYDINHTRTDQPFGFSIRRARFDVNASANDNLDILVEIGTPSTPLRSSGSDIGIIEARGTTPIFGDGLSLRMGKFVVPFSGENSRSSRKLDTVERSSLVGSLIANNVLDTQIGLMLFGREPAGVFNYYLTLVNGGSDNLSTSLDGNGFKQFQAKFALKPHRDFYFAVAYDTDSEKAKTFHLYDHAFVKVVSGAVSGRRHGFETDFDWTLDMFNWKTEFIYYTFPERPAGGVRYLWGGYSQFGLFFSGDTTRGVQGILRGEFTRVDPNTSNGHYDLASSVVGINGYINANLNLQFNYIIEFPNEEIRTVAATDTYKARNAKHIGFGELQVKF